MFSRVPSYNTPAAAVSHHNHHQSHHQYDLTTATTTATLQTSTAAAASTSAAADAIVDHLTYDPLSAAASAIHAAALTVDDEEFNRLSGDPNWWQNAIEEDSFDSPLPFDASESGLWNGRFVPPPPRPPFLDESIATDGLTTCDLCTWAWHDRNSFSLDASIGEAAGELGWAFTLIIVSVISALLGAIVMVIVLRCRRLKTSNANAGHRPLPWWSRGNRNQAGGGGGGGVGGSVGGGVNRNNMTIKQSADSIRSADSLHNNPGVWTWLGQRRQSASPDHHHHHHHHHQRGATASAPAENHYTHMDDSYSPVGLGGSSSAGMLGGSSSGGGIGGHSGGLRSGGGGGGHSGDSGGGSGCHGGAGGGDEALYAELDRESIRSANPSYQNTAYSQCGEHDADAVPIVSSAPSSAYYSDLSTTGTATTLNDRGYEVVGLTHMSQPMPSWDSSDHGSNGRRPPRLAAINETSTTTTTTAASMTTSVPSDYV